MRIRVNLAQPESRAERMVYLWAPLAVLVALALFARFSYVTGKQVIEYRNVHRSVLRYQAETREIRTNEERLSARLRQPATLELYAQTNFLNALIDQKKVPLSGLTLAIAKLLPEQVRITGLSLSGGAGAPVVEVSVEGALDQVTGNFLDHLEKSPDFESVTVMNQAFESQKQQRDLVSLTCSARYVGPPLPGSAPDRAQP
ncbi:MAG: hypothetical protein ACRD3D_17075 [Terriglobia bacterium]